MTALIVVLCVALGISIFMNVQLWELDRELKYKVMALEDDCEDMQNIIEIYKNDFCSAQEVLNDR